MKNNFIKSKLHGTCERQYPKTSEQRTCKNEKTKQNKTKTKTAEGAAVLSNEQRVVSNTQTHTKRITDQPKQKTTKKKKKIEMSQKQRKHKKQILQTATKRRQNSANAIATK